MKAKAIIIFLAFSATLAGVVWILHRSCSTQKEIRNVVLISIDTCRADYLSCYGCPQNTTPNIDAFAAQATVFENTISPVPITLPAHSSILTGTIPPYHGVHDNIDYKLDKTNITLAEILKGNGFTTGGIISALVLDSRFGVDQGFDTYNDYFEEERTTAGNITERVGAETSRHAINWLKKHQNENFFLFLHYFEPHAEYSPPEPFASKFREKPYAGEIAYTDHCIGQVLEKLKELQLYNSTLIIITSDHGEMLQEHREPTHSYFIYQSAIRVPLIFRLPGQVKPQKIKGVAGLIDIVPTVCSLLGIKMSSEVQGMDLSAYVKGHKHQIPKRSIFCESLTPTKYDGNSLLGVVTDRWKYIQTTRPELYDIVNDTTESTNLIKQKPHQGRILQDILKQTLEKSVRNKGFESKIQLDTKSRRQLESLGYVAGGIIEDFSFDKTREDPKDLINFYVLSVKATNLAFQGKYRQAEDLSKKLINIRPDSYVCHEVLATIAWKQEDYPAAIEHLNNLLELRGDDAKVHNNLGTVLQLEGREDEAITHYYIALESRPEFVEAHNNLAMALLERGEPDTAIKHLQEALILYPDYFEARCNLGNTLVNKGMIHEAIVEYRQALKIKTNQAEVYRSLAKALRKQGKLEEAICHYEKAIWLDPKLAPAQNSLGEIYYQKGDFDKALAYWSEALKINPEQVSVLNNIAWLKAAYKDKNFHEPKTAVQLARKACELTNYKGPALLHTLSVAYAADGRFDEAIKTAEKALSAAEAVNQPKLSQAIRNKLQLYKAKKTK